MTDHQNYTTVNVHEDYTIYLNSEGVLHRTDGPAVEWSDGSTEFWVKGKRLTKGKFKALTSKPTFSGTIIEIDGIKYQLKEVK
jgi:hypothetical protein